MSKFCIGDIVKIREDIAEFNKRPHAGVIVAEMEKRAGEEFEVTQILETEYNTLYDTFVVDDIVRYGPYYWLDEWLIPVEVVGEQILPDDIFLEVFS